MTSKTARPSKCVARPGDEPGAGKRAKPFTNQAEHDHIERVLAMPCVLCARLGMTQSGRTFAHHARTGQGASQRASDFLAIPLCYACHQGDQGIHGDRSLMRVAKVEELDLLGDVIGRIAA